MEDAAARIAPLSSSDRRLLVRLHKLRAALVRPDREPLGPFVQIDETLVGGKGSPHKELVLVAAEADGRPL